jgi:hypothetical protein
MSLRPLVQPARLELPLFDPQVRGGSGSSPRTSSMNRSASSRRMNVPIAPPSDGRDSSGGRRRRRPSTAEACPEPNVPAVHLPVSAKSPGTYRGIYRACFPDPAVTWRGLPSPQAISTVPLAVTRTASPGLPWAPNKAAAGCVTPPKLCLGFPWLTGGARLRHARARESDGHRCRSLLPPIR